MTNKGLISQTLARHMLSCIHEYELIKIICRNYEMTFDSAEEMVKIAAIKLLVRKI